MNKPIYFPSLNALRFWAALFVVFGHIEQFKGIFGISDGNPEHGFILARFAMSGNDAVMLFFVLSGFLITYLLLAEIEQTENVSVRSFYVRRVLRIWPLYYIIVLIAFFAIPLFIKITQFEGYYLGISLSFWPKFILFLLFLPNVAQIYSYYPVGASHLWSIGVEEYFYVLWPVLIRRFRKNILPALLGVILVRLVISLFIAYRFTYANYAPTTLIGFDFYLIALSKFPFENMAIGGLGAYILYHQHQKILNVIFHPVSSTIILLLMGINVFFMDWLTFAPILAWSSSFVRAALYTVFLLNISSNPYFPLKLENPSYNLLGKLSYGIYMYHISIIYVVLVLFDKMQWQLANTTGDNLLLYSIIIALTIGISYLSYQYVEKPFLRLKQKFTIVHSGDATLANNQ